jgi:uncharacterized protein (DUF885 family)
MKFFLPRLLFVFLALISARAAVAETDLTPDERLHALFAAADEAHLQRNPWSAHLRGDLRFADRLGDYLSDAYFAAEREAAEEELAALRAIERSSLSSANQIAYDVFEYNRLGSLKDFDPAMLALTVVRPIDHFNGAHRYYPMLASGRDLTPFKTTEDYENNLKRHGDYVIYLDRAIERFRQGMASGVTNPRMTIANVIEQLEQQLNTPLEESPYYGPIAVFPESFSEEVKTDFAARHRRAIAEQIYPAYQRLVTFLRDEYLPVAREGVGLVHMPGGDKVYQRLIESMTTLPLTADEIHETGLREVARLHREIKALAAAVGFEGTLAEFFQFVRTDSRFHPASAEWLLETYREIGREVDQRVGRLFSLVPKTALEIRPFEAFREKHQAAAIYVPGTPDGSRPGVFFVNTYDLPSRSVPMMTAIYLHEATPGHHYQISLAQENESQPNFMRFGGNTAYFEGWALYTEWLGYELGVYEDPYQRYGQLEAELWRAIRLVVDTGIHARGWTRAQTIAYMKANSSLGETSIVAETERYIAIPGQALSYLIGMHYIMDLRTKAEAALGDRFDIREFHTQVLDSGALPLPVLGEKIRDWVWRSL